MKTTVYDIITNMIIERLEQGEIPWRQPWRAATQWPTNLVSKREYRGVNVIVLAMQRRQSPYWLTFKQVGALGANVKKGAQSVPVVFWKFSDELNEETGKVEKRAILRYYRVFNSDDCENIDPAKIPTVAERELDEEAPAWIAAEALIAGYKNGPGVDFGFSHAAYIPGVDKIEMPKRSSFVDDPAYYSVYAHELGHSTGHPSRLGRRAEGERRAFGSTAYAKEELVAEVFAAFFCAEAGLLQSTIEPHAGYIESWLKALKSDKRMIVIAAAQAQKAFEFFTGRQSDKADEIEE